MIWLVRLYPRQWRERYGAELEQLIDDLLPSRSRLSLALDLVAGAAAVHLRQGTAVSVELRRSIARAAAIAGVVWLGLSVEILLSNVVFPSKTDDDAIPVVTSYLAVFAALFLAGMVAARGGAGGRGQMIAGLVAGVLIGLLTAASFAIVDNVWLDIVAQQPSKVEGFAHSRAASMRDFINDGLVGVAVFLPIALGIFGAALGRLGGLVGGARASSPGLRY